MGIAAVDNFLQMIYTRHIQQLETGAKNHFTDSGI